MILAKKKHQNSLRMEQEQMIVIKENLEIAG